MSLMELASQLPRLSGANRAIRLRLSAGHHVYDDALLVKRVWGTEALCGAFEYRLLCVSTDVTIPLKNWIALPIELQFVTASGQLRSACGIVAQVAAGESDGGLATYQLVIRDALTLMEQRNNTRVFRNCSEVDISAALLSEWRIINPILAKAFDIDLGRLSATYPAREFIMQHNESDAHFLRRLWKRQGISWFVRPGVASAAGTNETPAHTLVLFDHPDSLEQNAAGAVRFHRDDATQSADGVFAWGAVRNMSAGSVMRQSWDYRKGAMMSAHVPTTMRQGEAGDQFAPSLDDYLTDTPHAGDSMADYQRLGQLRMQRHEFEAKRFQGESGVRDFCVGQWIRLEGHPEIDIHAEHEREFVLTELSLSAENNLPKDINDKINRLFAVNGWHSAGSNEALDAASAERGVKYTNRFTCVRRGIAIVPPYDPRSDLPRVNLQSALVVAPPGEEVFCDALGRVKVRFPATREQDHSGAGASSSEGDSAWVRVATQWAGDQWGSIHLPRVGDEVLVDFINGDPDKPVVISRVYGTAKPPAFTHIGDMPGNRFVAGIKSKEINGVRYNQLRLDDTPGQISAQVASEHGHSQLNLGWLTHPRKDGKGRARGEGAELCSDKAVAVHGKRGVFITADGQGAGSGELLQRDSLLSLAEVLRTVQQQLSQLSDTHGAEPTATAALDKAIDRLRDWDVGSNTRPGESGGQAAVVAVSAPDGIAIASQENLLLGAQCEIDLASVTNTQISTGKKFLVRAAEAVSIFAHKLGIKLIAASGKMELQTHKDNIELTSARRIVLSAADEIVLQAPKIRFITEGAQVDIGADEIIQQCAGDFIVKSPKFAHASGRPGTLADLKLPTSYLKSDERIVLFDPQSGSPIVGRAYRAVLHDGQVIEGKTDALGRTALMQSAAMGEVLITIEAHADE